MITATTQAHSNSERFFTAEHLRNQPVLQLAQRDTRLSHLKQQPVTALRMTPEDSYLSINLGLVGIFNRFPDAWRYGMEYRGRPLSRLALRPTAGVVSVENDASFLFLGLRKDFPLEGRWLLTGSFDAGYFEERGDLELGLELEFRSGLELAYRFTEKHRIGLALFHISNGGFGDRNPGTESLVLNLTLPIE